MLVVGLTGGVATGKSTVSRRLRELGAHVLDADEFAKEVVALGEPALEDIRKRFGEGVLAPDGSLDREKMATIVFGDERARADLEEIIHPRVRARMRTELERLNEAGAKIVVCDIPLLFETGKSLEYVDKVLVVYASSNTQKRRLMERDGLTPEEADRRIRAQMPTAKKAAMADWVIDNDKDLGRTLRRVDELWEEWMTLCKSL